MVKTVAETRQKPEWPADALERLAVVDGAFSEMTEPERTAALVWLKSKYRSDWPGDVY